MSKNSPLEPTTKPVLLRQTPRGKVVWDKPILLRPTKELRERLDHERFEQRRSLNNLIIIILEKFFRERDEVEDARQG